VASCIFNKVSTRTSDTLGRSACEAILICVSAYLAGWVEDKVARGARGTGRNVAD
jgi:hypothetical protein